MQPPKKLEGLHRQKLLDDLERLYGKPASFYQRLRYLRKKYLWLFFVEGSAFLKRMIDIAFSLTLIILFSPLIIMIALLIKLSDRGPVLYVDQRVGKWGREFLFPKFRSMTVGAHAQKESLKKHNIHNEDVKFKAKSDPRVTRLGAFLRKSSLDELPQLWCVLKGDMSMVGPRPPLPEEVAFYSLEQRRRLDVKPGLTCFWQVSGRSDIPFPKQVELDVSYIQSSSLWLDLKLILKTIPAILLGRGAY